MTLRYRHLFIAAILGGLVASALPAMAAQVGDALKLGETNIVNADTALRGDASANLVIRNTGSGVPLSLKNNTGGVPNGKPPMAVNSRRLVKNLNVDKVDFRDANELIRAAFSETGDAPNADGDAVAATITAPKPGVLVMGGGVAASGNTSDQYGCQLRVNGTVVLGSIRHSRIGYPGGDHTNNASENCETDGGTVVDKGSHTVAFRITDWSAVNLTRASVWVIWVPFDGEGNVPTP